MCWNADVSLNTFLFSMFMLALIFYNNTFTKYKLKEFDSGWMYIFVSSFVFMQLVEFFIWRNIDNKFYNNVFSIITTILLFIQPLASLMLLSNIPLRNNLLTLYLLLTVPFLSYIFATSHVHSVVGKSGHLVWNFLDKYTKNPVVHIIWLFFFLFSIVYENMWLGFIFTLVALAFAYVNYRSDSSMWSMWCWIVNSCMIYYAFYLLLVLPFLEKSGVL